MTGDRNEGQTPNDLGRSVGGCGLARDQVLYRF